MEAALDSAAVEARNFAGLRKADVLAEVADKSVVAFITALLYSSSPHTILQ